MQYQITSAKNKLVRGLIMRVYGCTLQYKSRNQKSGGVRKWGLSLFLITLLLFFLLPHVLVHKEEKGVPHKPHNSEGQKLPRWDPFLQENFRGRELCLFCLHQLSPVSNCCKAQKRDPLRWMASRKVCLQHLLII